MASDDLDISQIAVVGVSDDSKPFSASPSSDSSRFAPSSSSTDNHSSLSISTPILSFSLPPHPATPLSAQSSGSIRCTNSTLIRDNNPEEYNGSPSLYFAPPRPNPLRSSHSDATGPANQASHRHFRKRRRPTTSIGGPSVSRATHSLDSFNVLRFNPYDERRAIINTLPDEVLLHIFHFYQLSFLDGLNVIHRLHPSWKWHRLVHVCRKWRSVVFASPRFLNLTLVCNPTTCVELIGIWPPLQIVIRNMVHWTIPEDYDFDAAIAHHNRVCEINLLHLSSSQLQRLASAMQEQFPELIHLNLDFDGYCNRPAPALPDGFLGGSAPRLQFLELRSIPYPALPRLLLSSTNLVHLTLWNIPPSGYISPDAMVTCLSGLTSLKRLSLGFQSPQSYPDRRSRLPPLILTLPVLTSLKFKGPNEYLEDFVARIDAPLLDSILITFFFDVFIEIPQLAWFISRTARFKAFNGALMDFDKYGARFECFPPARAFGQKFGLKILCGKLDWQLSSLLQVFAQVLPCIDMEHLYIYEPRYLPSQWQDDIEGKQWLETLQLVTAVKDLYVCKEFLPCFVVALQELVGERVTEVSRTLECLFLEELQPSGPIQEAIGKFVAARQLSGHPITVSLWERD